MKKFLLCHTLSIILIFNIYGNAAQPGIYRAGGGGGFTLYFPDDLPNFKKIQMQREEISILLYPGFAVVQGDYFMKNDGDSSISIKTGYPLNAYLDSPSQKGKLEIAFDSLYLFKSYFNEKEVDHKLVRPNKKDKQLMIGFLNEDNYEDWYFWETKFPPKSISKISVQFIVNTNNAKVRQGYSVENENVFVYVIETGALWKDKIEKGAFKIFLGKGLKLKNMLGISPMSDFLYSKNESILKLEKSNYVPTSSDNIIIKYANKTKKTFDFGMVLNNGQQYFNELEVLHHKDLSQLDFKPYRAKDPTIVKTSFLWNAIMFGFLIILFCLPIYLVWLLFKFIKKRKYI